MKLSDIVARLGGELIGEDREVSQLAPLESADQDAIAFLSNPKYHQQLLDTQAAAVIIHCSVTDAPEHLSIIRTDDPYLYFAQLSWLFHPKAAANGKRHPTAVVEDSAVVPASCEIGAHAYIGANTRLGENCRVLAGAVVEHDCVLGDDCVIHPNVSIYHGCTLGNRVEIHSGTVIGGDGFGYAPVKTDGSWFKIPQTGGVTLADDVEIGSNSTVDRGALEDTRIGRGSKIDNFVQIAHNCQIGEHTVIASCTGISGSCKIGSHVVIAGGVGMAGHLTIADKTFIGGGTNITKSITEAGHYASVYPMQTFKEWSKNAVYVRRLADMNSRIKQLEQTIATLTGAQDTQKDA